MLDAWIVIVMLGIVILLYAFLLPKPAPRKTVDEEVLDTVEDTLASFVEEMEQENREFARVVGDMKREHEQKTSALLNRIEFLERKTAMLTEQLSSAVTVTEPAASSSVFSGTDSRPTQNPEAEAPALDKPSGLKSRYKEVFELYDEGKSIEYIAKKLGTNKGEVQLIIQLSKREEQTDASK